MAPILGRLTLMTVCALAAAALIAGFASANTGQITRAWTNAEWTRGSIAGSVTWTGCEVTAPGATCSWLPRATVRPALPSYNCPTGHSETWPNENEHDPNVRMVWNGAPESSHLTSGTVSFDMTNVSILSGVQGQRLCVSVVEATQIVDPVCLAQKKIIEELTGKPVICELVNRYYERDLANALFSLEPPPSQPSPTTGTTPRHPCVVPNLDGKKLRAAKHRAKNAGCKIGKVKMRGGATATTGKIVKQKPKAGKNVPAGTRIVVTLR